MIITVSNVLLLLLLLLFTFAFEARKKEVQFTQADVPFISGVVIAVSIQTSRRIVQGMPSAMATRAMNFEKGLREVNVSTALVEYSDIDTMKSLAKTHSHIVLLDFYDKYIHAICDTDVYSAIREFKHISLHTIEASYKFSSLNKTLTKMTVGDFCDRLDAFSTAERFSKVLLQMDAVLNGLSDQALSFRKKLNSGQRIKKRVVFVPVPIPLEVWAPSTKPKKRLRIFLDWDDRKSIGKVDAAAKILKGIHDFRVSMNTSYQSLLRANPVDKSTDTYTETYHVGSKEYVLTSNTKMERPFPRGVDLIVSRDLPMELAGITSWRNMTGGRGRYLSSHKFLSLLASCHVYATAIRSSYENPVVEAQMAGAVVMSVSNIVKPELYRSIYSIVADQPSELTAGLTTFFISRPRIRDIRIQAIHDWILRRHAPKTFACAFIRAVSARAVSKTKKKTPSEVQSAYPLCFSPAAKDAQAALLAEDVEETDPIPTELESVEDTIQ
jgi:hypothetical protein